MKKCCYIILWLCLILYPAGIADTQDNELAPHFVSLTAQGITFSQIMPTGIQRLGSLPDTFAVESLGGQAEWLIRGKPSFALSPNGQSVAFTARRADEAALFIYTFHDDSLLQRSIPSYWLFPLWSPDTQALLLYAPLPYLEPVTVPENYIYHVAADEFIQITHSNYIDRDFVWTDDSQGIVYLGACEYACAGRKLADYYWVSRDGTARQTLTDVATQIPDFNPYNGRCHLTWSPDNQRWYYEVGCATGPDEGQGQDSIYSVDLSGDHRLEVNLSIYFTTVYPEGELDWMDVKTIQSTSSGVYLSLHMAFYPGISPYSDMRFIQWRVLKLDFSGEITTAYEPALPIPENEDGYWRTLDESAVSPDEKYVAMIVGSLLQVIDLDTDQVVAEVNPGSICDTQWLDNNRLIFNVAFSDCDDVTVASNHVEILSVLDGNVTHVFENTDDISWFLPIPNLMIGDYG